MGLFNNNGVSKLNSDGTAVVNATEGAGFSYLYDGMNYKGTLLKEVYNSSKDIYVTKITSANPYYYHTGTDLGSGVYGINRAVTINNAGLVKDMSQWNEDSKYALARNYSYNYDSKTGLGPTLVNCVGWATGRVWEIWNQCINQGIIVSNGTNEYKFADTDVKVVGYLKNTDLPICNACNFYDYWPDAESNPGFNKSSVDISGQLSFRPLPGDIVCWASSASSSSHYGHVAVVEAVYNRDTDDEYIVVSESGWHKARLPYLVTAETVYKYKNGNHYPYSNDTYVLKGFLRSPVSQLSALGGSVAVEASSTSTGKANNIAKATATLSSYKKTLTELNKGDRVRVTWLGNAKKDGSGRNSNFIDGKYYVQTIDLSAEYPYGLSATSDGEVLGYFQRHSLSLNLLE